MMKKTSRFQFTTERPVAILMIVIGIAVFGFISYQKLVWDLMPKIDYPSFTIRTLYPGAAPEEVENIVSRPLEAQLSLIKDLRSITSVSRPEQSDIIMEFSWEVNLDRAAQEIREKIDQVYLDRAVERPMILRFDPTLDPILRLGIQSPLPQAELRQLVEDEIARELEALPGVAAAKVKGGFEEEILIKIDENKLARSNIPFSLITSRLSQENINLAGGNIKEGETDYIVRTLNEFKTIAEIGEIIISEKNKAAIRLKDLADVIRGHKERTVITRVNGAESIELNIYKEADANTVAVSRAVKDRIFGSADQQAYVKNKSRIQQPPEKKKSEIKKPTKGKKTGRDDSFQQDQQEKMMTNFLSYRLPKDFAYSMLSDQSVFIENSINEVKNTAIIGGILAAIILFFFLKSFSTTMIVAVSIPLSVVAAFAPLNLWGVSLNIMSLGGLALGIGMLVDNSIVVMESISRCREEGDDLIQSTVRGVSEVGGAVVASTLTTIAVFFPIVFVEGIAGQIFKDLSLAVVFSLLASLLVSLFFIPMLASRNFSKNTPVSKTQIRYTYSFKSSPSVMNFLRIPLECGRFLGLILLQSVAVLGQNLLGIITILLFPLLVLLNKAIYPKQWIIYIQDHVCRKSALWENYLNYQPLFHFYDAMHSSKKFWTLPFVYLYRIFVFLFESLTFLFSRLLLAVTGLITVLLKALLMIVSLPLLGLLKILTKGFDRFYNALNRIYPLLLEKSLKRDVPILAIMVLLFILVIWQIVPRIGSELIPEVHQGTIHLNLTLPVGTAVEKTDEQLNLIGKKLESIPQISSFSYFAGTSNDELSEDETGEHIGKITINIKKNGDIRMIEEQVIALIRQSLTDFTDMDYNIGRPVLFSMKPPIQVIFKGYNLEQLRSVSQAFFLKIENSPGLKDVQTSIKAGYPELVVQFDRLKLSHYQLNAYEVASLIKNKIQGIVATQYKNKDRRIDLRVYLKDDQRMQAENLRNLIIDSGKSAPILLQHVAEIAILSGPNEIRRIDQVRSAVISANISGINLKSATEKIYQLLETHPLPPGISYELSGQNQEMETSLNSLKFAMLLAIFLVYIVMASQFESFMHPFLILFTIPMALIGVFLVLFFLKIPLSITVYIGIITLVGVVVNNAIVLIDYINLLRKKGMEKLAAIQQAGSVRLRPIIITTTTTVLGLLPMALGLGEGSEIRTPMAISIIAGLTSATFLTLIIIPIVYKRFSK